MDHQTIVGKAELIVTPVPVPLTDPNGSETVTEHSRVVKFNDSIVIRAKQADPDRHTLRLLTRVTGIRDRHASKLGIMRTTMIPGIKIPR